MAKKQVLFKTKGMNRDLSVSTFNPEFAFENRNLRLFTEDGNTLMSWVNEKGTALIPLVNDVEYWSKSGEANVYINPNDNSWTYHAAYSEAATIHGVPIGTAIINRTLVLFTTNSTDNTYQPDCIYKLSYNDDKTKMLVKNIIYGTLNFDVNNPIETLVSYESESIQKVYWVDGRNQPRIINIVEDYNPNTAGYHFDFISELKLEETVTVKKLLGASGMFAPGVIQYAFTYYNKNGQESNIFYTTPLYYISYKDRGGSPDERIDNAFEITVTYVDDNFDYLRIYSIQRTSLNGTPICKRIQDISIRNLGVGNTSVSYIDRGTSGNTIDPTELLYKGGDAIIAHTIEQKDGTLFLGNIETLVNRALGAKVPASDITVSSSSGGTPYRRKFKPFQVNSGDYKYSNQLTAVTEINNEEYSVPCAGFKWGDVYRCGVQFQHKTGKWSAPTYIDNVEVKDKPEIITEGGADKILIPILKGTISANTCSTLLGNGFVKARAVVVYPSIQDRLTICQGVVCPTLYTDDHRRWSDNTNNTNTNKGRNDLYAQSSWFFRPFVTGSSSMINSTLKTIAPTSFSNGNVNLIYTSRDMFDSNPYNPEEDAPNNIREVEIQGEYNPENKFKIDQWFLTLNSPDIEFDDQLFSVDYSSLKCKHVGMVTFEKTFSNINIQTETPTSSNDGSGFIHKSFVDSGVLGIVSGLFYDDYVINDGNTNTDPIGAYDEERSSVKWMVYPWNKTGSLNNDINRPAGKGVATAVLKKKVISNLRYASTALTTRTTNVTLSYDNKPQLFNSDEPSVLKVGSHVYMGNVDTVLNPDKTDGMYFAFNFSDGNELETPNVNTPFESDVLCKTFYLSHNEDTGYGGACWKYKFDTLLNTYIWDLLKSGIGDDYTDLAVKKNFVRMKYKSSPHLVIETLKTLNTLNTLGGVSLLNNQLPIFEIVRNIDSSQYGTLFGGESNDALMEHTWVPCGEPVRLDNTVNIGTEQNPNMVVQFEYSWGDTYYQRYDCLKTYPFTKEDENQIVEIGSFMLETRVNIDGRYDRNRGLVDNTNMSPQNFNLINPVYSQINNFFSYKILPDNYYADTKFPNLITWSRAKESGADVDLWTNITLASILELDGDKGSITKIKRLNDKLLCFLDSGISQILYNENVQVSTESGVPVEIANSGRVDGKRYLSSTIGCSNKWSMTETPLGIYFMDSNDKSIYLLGNEGLKNISQLGGFDAWCKQNIPASGVRWTSDSFDNFRAVYDKLNQDVFFINKKIALAWNEKIEAFTSFYDYGDTPYFCNLDDTGIWVRTTSAHTTALWKHHAGDYCKFFNSKKPYWMTLIGNPEPQIDKTFTNLEFRACVDGDGEYDESTGKFTPALPFNSLEVWNEYQHGYTALDIKSGHNAMLHGGDSSALKRKFRIWRCDIPRNNCLLDTDRQQGNTYNYSLDADLGISRHIRKPNDRIRNPWLYLKLKHYTEPVVYEYQWLESDELHQSIIIVPKEILCDYLADVLLNDPENHSLNIRIFDSEYTNLILSFTIPRHAHILTDEEKDILAEYTGDNFLITYNSSGSFEEPSEYLIVNKYPRYPNISRCEIHDIVLTYFN